MSDRRHLSRAAAWPAAPMAAIGRLATIAASPRNWAATPLAKLLGRTELPQIGELAALHPTTRVLLAGFASWIVLVLLVTISAVVAVEISAISLPDWLSAPSSKARGAVVRAPASFDLIVQRPLFSRSRQSAAPVPIQDLPPPPVASQVDQEFTLKGVFISGPSAGAFLLSPEMPLGVWVRTDEEILGWKVVAIRPDQVILQGQGETRTVWLHHGRTK